MVLKLSTGKSSKILIHGTSKTWHIPHDAWKIIKENHYEWTAHSHPTMTKIIASPEDRETLKLFTWQEKSIIIDLKGNTKEFTASTQDWINEILGVTGYDKREKDLSLDIEIELEYLIESEQLIRRKPNHKNPRYRWEARIK